MAKRKSKKPKQSPAGRQNIQQVQPKRAGSDDARKKSPASEEKSIGKKLALWLPIITAILVIATFVLDLPEKLSKNWQPASARFWGQVVDQNGRGIAGAQLIVLTKAGGDTIGIGATDTSGAFDFIVSIKHQESARVKVIKDGHVGYDGFKVIGPNARIPFK